MELKVVLIARTRPLSRGRAFKAGFRKPNARNGTQPEPCLSHNFTYFQNLSFEWRAKRMENFEFY